MHLLFLTTNNLATNPRLVKELKTAIELGATLTVVQFKLGNWSDNKSEQLKEVVGGEKLVVSDELRGTNTKKREVEFIEIDATSKRKLSWLKWGVLEKLAQRIYPLFKNNLFINALASSRRSLQLVNVLKKSEKADLIVAHNLGALYPAYVLSKKWHIPFIFDVEDYHPGEHIRLDAQNERARREFLMKTLLPKASAITTASPLIGEYTLKLIGGHLNHTVILNSFPKSEFIPPLSHSTLKTHIPLCRYRCSAFHFVTTPLRFDSELITQNPELNLVWFSQKISFGRGLEQLFEALKLLHSAIHYPSQSEEAENSIQKIDNNNDINHQPSTLNPELPTPTPKLSTPNYQPITHNSQLSTPNLNLTLIGDLDPEFNLQIIEPFLAQLETLDQTVLPPSSGLRCSVSLKIMSPMTQSALHAELANHDVGLALEFSNTDLNRQLCLTNKILAYAQAGLYILATNTPAQSEFMNEDPTRGVVCGQTPREMAEAILNMMEQHEAIKSGAIQRFEKGKELAWEKERGKLHAIWEEQPGTVNRKGRKSSYSQRPRKT